MASCLIFTDVFDILPTIPEVSEVANENCREGTYLGHARVKFLPDHLDFYSKESGKRDLDYYQPVQLVRDRHSYKVGEWNLMLGIGNVGNTPEAFCKM